MILEKKKKQLLEKMEVEQEEYKRWLCSMQSEEILSHTFSYTTREDILIAFEDMNLDEKKVDALLKSQSPLEDIYNEYCNTENDYMDNIRQAIENRANYVLLQQQKREREER